MLFAKLLILAKIRFILCCLSFGCFDPCFFATWRAYLYNLTAEFVPSFKIDFNYKYKKLDLVLFFFQQKDQLDLKHFDPEFVRESVPGLFLLFFIFTWKTLFLPGSLRERRNISARWKCHWQRTLVFVWEEIAGGIKLLEAEMDFRRPLW